MPFCRCSASAGPGGFSEITECQRVHPSLVLCQLQDLEDMGYVRAETDPSDGRSRLVSLTRAGKKEMARLQKLGIDRFAPFMEDWQPGEVRTLTMLLEKLETSKAAAAAREHQSRHAQPSQLGDQPAVDQAQAKPSTVDNRTADDG